MCFKINCRLLRQAGIDGDIIVKPDSVGRWKLDPQGTVEETALEGPINSVKAVI